MGRFGRAVAFSAAIAVAGAAVAQTVADNAVPETGLNIPANLQLFGKVDPNIRKPTAIVNETVITGTDVDQRLALILAANDTKPSAAELQQLRLRILGILVDETLQIQEAKAHDVKVTTEEIDQGFGRVARNFQKSVADLKSYLRSIGSSDRSLRRQIEAELAWSRYLRRRVSPFVNVGDEEVAAVLQRLEAAKGTSEFHIKEIYLAATSERAQQVYAEGRALLQDIQQGKRTFEDVAAARSDASTRVVGGDLGWVKPAQLPDSLAQAAATMNVNQIAGPIETAGGFSILFMADKRQVLTADPRDAVLSLRQISLPFPKGITQTEASAKVADFAKTMQSLKGCGDVPKVAAGMGAEVVDNDSVKVRDLPVQLQEMMTKLQVGEATPPFGSPTDGVRSLVVCSRDEPKTGQLPGKEQVRDQMEQQAVNLRADHKLRDLRRDAIIEYR
jgi:peptidyl-prolyl cis-trans isomerase SurA